MQNKKIIAIILFLFITNIFFISAAEDLTNSEKNNPIFSALQKEIQIAPQFQLLYSILTAFDDTTTASLLRLIVLILFFIIIFISAYTIIEFTAFETRWTKIVIALSISIITSTIGWTTNLTSLIFNAKETVNIWLTSWKFYASLIGIFVFLFGIKIIAELIKKVKTNSKEEESTAKTKLAGQTINELAKLSKEITEESKK